MPAQSKARRHFSLLTYLVNAGRPVSRRAVFQHLREYYGEYGDDETGAGRQMFIRDLDELEALGFKIHRRSVALDGKTAVEGYELERRGLFLPELNLSPEELAAVHLAAANVAHDESFPYAAPLELALAKLTFDGDPDLVAQRMAEAGVVLHHPLRREARGAGKALDLLMQAMRRRKRIRFHYRARLTGVETDREADPYGLYLQRGLWVLVAQDHLRGAIRRFHVHRMSGLELLDQGGKLPAFEAPEDFQVRDHMEPPAWRYEAHPPLVVDLDAREEFAWLVKRELGQSSRPLGDWARFQVKTTNLDGLLAWVRGHGPKLRVAAPPEARERLRATLEGILRRQGAPA